MNRMAQPNVECSTSLKDLQLLVETFLKSSDGAAGTLEALIVEDREGALHISYRMEGYDIEVRVEWTGPRVEDGRLSPGLVDTLRDAEIKALDDYFAG